MKLTKKQKDQIYNKSMAVDDCEWVPCINHVLKILNYDDLLEHDENYEWVKWTGTEPLIKDEEIPQEDEEIIVLIRKFRYLYIMEYIGL